jgi:hypothetical protein
LCRIIDDVLLYITLGLQCVQLPRHVSTHTQQDMQQLWHALNVWEAQGPWVGVEERLLAGGDVVAGPAGVVRIAAAVAGAVG